MSSGKQCNSSYLTTLKSPDSKFSCCFVRFWICKEPLHMFQWCDCIFSVLRLLVGQVWYIVPSHYGTVWWRFPFFYWLTDLWVKTCPQNLPPGYLSWESARLLTGRSRVKPAGPTLRVFEWLRRKCFLCNDIYKRLDFLLFSVKDEKL